VIAQRKYMYKFLDIILSPQKFIVRAFGVGLGTFYPLILDCPQACILLFATVEFGQTSPI